MATCYLNKSSGYWVVAFRYLNRRYTKSFAQEEEARKYLETAEADLKVAKRLGTLPALLATHTPKARASGVSNPKVTTFWEAYREYTEYDHTIQTIQGYHMALESLDWKHGLAELTPQHLQDWKKRLLADGKALPTVNSYLRRLRVLFNWGIKQGMLTSNPAKEVKFLKADRYDPKPYLTKPEIDTLLRAAFLESEDYPQEEGYTLPQNEAPLYWIVCLGIFAGLRLNEIICARWEWINPPRDFDTGGSITVRSGFQFRVKARQARTIPLHARLRPLLTLKGNRTGYILKPEITTWNPKSFRWHPHKQYYSMLEKAGLDYVNRYGQKQKVNFHTLRHTFCSMLAQSGYSSFEIMKLAGHSDLRVSESYSHLAPHEKGIDW